MPKSTRPLVRIHDVETDQIIDREMNDEEFAEHQSYIAAKAEAEAEALAKTEAKAALLERLGITEDEAKLLLG